MNEPAARTNYRICEANRAPGFQALERACGIDVPDAVFDWIAASQEVQDRPLRAVTGEALIDLVFGRRLRLRAIRSRSRSSAPTRLSPPAITR